MNELNKDKLKELLNHAVFTRIVEFYYYYIDRNDGRFDIHVHEILSEGDLKEKFWAVPRKAWIEAEEEFCGEGSSSDEALHDCLLKIKEAGFDQSFRSRLFSSERE